MKTIVIIGPESTGKSTLCQQLAEHYNTSWCPEFARDYLLQNGKEYTFNDLLTIARGQVTLEENLKITARSNHYFIDTDMYVMKVWCEVAFNNCHTWILKQIAQREYALTLLCDVDLPWVQDELREYPDFKTRRKLFLIYKDLLINRGQAWAIISGNYEERLQSAITVIDSLPNNHLS